MQKYRGLRLVTGLALVAGAVLVGWRGHPRAGGFAVVELFTSEGCSSCPPAEALMARTQQENKELRVYCLAFHVDYWDHQGWKDVFSEAAYTDRQRQYSRWLHLSEIYTPQAVVNGRTEFVGSDASLLGKAIEGGLQQQEGPVLTLSGLRLDKGRLDWQYTIGGNAAVGGQHLSVVSVIVEKNAVTPVNGGENSGRKLTEAQVVRGMDVLKVDEHGSGSGHLDWPDGLGKANAEIIALLQDSGNGKILAAARAAIP
jgi:hypothetical protein